MLKRILIVVLITVLSFSFYFYNQATRVAQAQTTATLSLSPSSSSVVLNQTFTVNINLNTGGNPADGVDVYMLRFTPSVLQVVDSNTSVAGVQIAPGALLANTVINTVDNTAGTIQFSQSTTGGTSFTGSGTLATITFKGVAVGSSNANFDFIAGSTSDTNVAYQGVDQLSSVAGGTYSVAAPDTTAPTVSVTSPTGGSSVTGTITVSASASDNVGVAGVQFKLDGANLGSEDTASPYSTSWNTSTATVGTHTLTAVARDAAGNSTTSASVSVTVPAAFDFAMSNGGAKSVTQGSSVTNSITATLSAGTTQAVTFSASGLPSGVSASFAASSCSPTCTSTLTLTASSSATTGTAAITVTGVSGSLSRTTSFNLTVNTGTFQRTISIASLEARNTLAISGTLEALNSSTKALIKSYPYTTNSSGMATITFDIVPQIVYLKIKASPYLTRLLSGIDLNVNSTYAFPILLTGDINQDNIINSVDYSVLNTNWFTTNAGADLNQDGLVNSIDYSYMNKHWLVSGEQ